jgi:integrase
MATIIKRGKRYLARVRIEGFNPVAQSFASKEQARAWAGPLEKELRAQRERNTIRRDVTALTITDLVREYLQEPKVLKQRSLYDTQRRLAWFVNHYADKRLLEFGTLYLREARTTLAAGKRGPSTVNRHLACMRSAWNWGIAAELIPASHAWPKRLMMPEPAGRARFLSDKEWAALRDASKADVVVRAAMVISIAAGLRQGELLALTWGDVDMAAGTAAVQRSKSGKRRMVRLLDAGVAALKTLPKGAEAFAFGAFPKSHVFLNADGKPLQKSALNMRWRAVRKAAGVADFRWHDLRHTAASKRAQLGANPLQLKQLLGHSTLAMTARYSHLVPGDEIKGDKEVNDLLK